MTLLTLFSFHGRIRRLHWWVGSLMTTGVMLAIIMIGAIVMVSVYGNPANIPALVNELAAWCLIVVWAGAVWIHLALGVKRLHDRDSSGFLLLLLIVPVVNLGLFAVLAFFEGTQGPNQYGASPKGIGGRTGDRELSSLFS